MMKERQSRAKFPEDKSVKRLLDKLSDPNYSGGNIALPADASEVNRAKYQLCQLIARYRREHKLLQKDLATQIGIDESRVSDILRGKIMHFTLDRLAGYAAKLHHNLKIRIIAA